MAAIIFDFDGTIVDSFDYFANFLAKQAEKYPLSAEDREALNGLTLAKGARFLGHAWWQLPILYLQGLRAIEREPEHVHIFAGMDRVIEKLHHEGHRLFVVSSNSTSMIGQFLKRHSLDHYFVDYYGRVVVFGKSPALRRLMRQQKLDPKECVYVGDEPRDVNAARGAGMRCIAVTWGYTHESTLAATHPDMLVDTPQALLKILEEI